MIHPTSNSTQEQRQYARHHKSELNIVGPGELIGEGDTELVLNLLPPNLAHDAFEKLREEVQWNTMFHRGGEVPRLVAVQGEVNSDGSFPIYRHPADESPPLQPFSATVALIREHVEKVTNHPVNHVLIQHYRSGADYISEHSDKTVDIIRGTKIVNVSLGAQRAMTLRRKKVSETQTSESDAPIPGAPREHQRIPLPHNSILIMGLETNAKWMHAVRTDKRPQSTKTAAERAHDGERISLTFRHIGTFLTADQSRIYGQGAKGKTKEDARPVIRGGPEAEKLIIAFGEENHCSDFDWDAAYGEGFDVLHFVPHNST